MERNLTNDEIMWMLLREKLKMKTIMAEQGISTTTGISMINQSGAEPQEESGLPLGLPRQPDIMATHHAHAEAQRLSLISLLEQDKLVGTFVINTASQEDKPVWQFTHTATNVLNMHMRTMKTFFRLASWTLHFKFEFRSNFQQVGQCLVVQHNMPLELLWYLIGREPNTADETLLFKSYRLMTLLPHTKVAMGEDVDVNATMNWNIPIEGAQSYEAGYNWNTSTNEGLVREEYSLGKIFVIPAIQMHVSTGVTPEMTVRIWSRLSNLKLAAYDPRDPLL